MTAVITFLSDYGHDDEFVGVCHGVMARIAPAARILDVNHGIDRLRSGGLCIRPSCASTIEYNTRCAV